MVHVTKVSWKELMARFTQNWYVSIVQGKNNANSTGAIFSNVPVMPWIHHRLTARAGHYLAITNAEVAYVPRNILAELAKQDSLINELLQVQFELASLSDRVGVCCLSLLSKEDKLKAFTSTWALNFGTRFLTEKAER